MADKKPSNPVLGNCDFDGCDFPSHDITLRDIFAAAALTGLISAYPCGASDAGIEGIAHDAYSFADAMLAEREKSNG